MADTRIEVDVPQAGTTIFDDQRKAMATAAMRSARLLADDIKQAAAADISAAGFSQQWQRSLSVRVYPQDKDAVNPAVYVFDRIPYAGVFEDGAVISGDPLLWLPLPSARDFLGGNQRLRPRDFASLGYDLVSIKGAAKPLLGVRRTVSNVTTTTPVFIGLPAVTIRKKFHLRAVFERAAQRWPSLYASAFKA